MSFSSSSTSSWATPRRPAAPHSAQVGNARFITSLQPSTIEVRSDAVKQGGADTCVLVGSPRVKPTSTPLPAHAVLTKQSVTNGAKDVRLRRVLSSSSSSSYASQYSATYSYYSTYATTSDPSETAEAQKNVCAAAARVATESKAKSEAGLFPSTSVEQKSTITPIKPQAALSSDPFVQMQQELHHPRVTMRQLRQDAAPSVMGNAARGAISNDQSCVAAEVHATSNRQSSAAAVGVSAVPGWWSCESSVLPADSSVTTSSTSVDATPVHSAIAADTRHAKTVLASDVMQSAQLRARGRPAAGEAMDRTIQRAVQQKGGLLSSPSSCGCATSCSCRTDDSTHADRQRRSTSGKKNALFSLRALQQKSRGDDTSDSVGGSDTGTTPTDASSNSSESEESWCTSCRRGCRLHQHNKDAPRTSASDTTASLCSSCEAAARTRVLHFPLEKRDACSGNKKDDLHRNEEGALLHTCECHHCVRNRKGTSSSYVQRDVFAEAIKADMMWTEVPPLLHLRYPTSVTAGGEDGGNAAHKSDGTILSERERAELRAAYIRHAAALLAGDDDKRTTTETPHTNEGDNNKNARVGGDAVAGPDVAVPVRCTSSTQTDKTFEELQNEEASRLARERAAAAAAEEEEKLKRARQHEAYAQLAEERLKNLAATQCAEVALPMLQRELENYETRATQQQQQRFDTLLQQLHACQAQLQQEQAAREEALQEHRRQWEAEQQRTREVGELRKEANRRDEGTVLDRDDAHFVLLAKASADAARAAVLASRSAVGTQHSDGTLERLASARGDATHWMTSQLLILETERREDVVAWESEARHQLLHCVEEPTRRVLLKCQAGVLHAQQRWCGERDGAALKAELRVLQLQETIARQELTERGLTCLRETSEHFRKQRDDVVAAEMRRDLREAQQACKDTQQQLTALQAEHQDTLAHVRQLRLQLIHALRMPTITFNEASSTATSQLPAPGEALLNAAYAYATATVGGGDGGSSSGIAEQSRSVSGNNGATVRSALREVEDMPVHRRFARAHQEALRVVRAQCRTV